MWALRRLAIGPQTQAVAQCICIIAVCTKLQELTGGDKTGLFERSREQTVGVRIRKCKARRGCVWEWKSLFWSFKLALVLASFQSHPFRPGCPQASSPLCTPALGDNSQVFQETFSGCIKRCGPAFHAAEVVRSGSLDKKRFLKHSPNAFQN